MPGDLDAAIRPNCDRGEHVARWSVCNLEGDQMQPIVRAFACGRHLHSVLVGMRWELDCVQVYDLSIAPEGMTFG